MSDTEHPPHRQALLLPGRFSAAIQRHRSDGAHAAALERLRHEAEALLQATPRSVLDKAHVPPTGDKRDYFSLSIYYWPDPEQPDGLPYQPRDGLVNPETEDYDGPYFTAMARDVDTLACAYAATGDERFAAQAARILRVWFLDPGTGMHPNLLCAQYVPGENVTTPWADYPARFVPGRDGRAGIWVSYGGVIEDLCLLPLSDAIRLIEPSAHWTAADAEGMRGWYRAYADWLEQHQHGADEAACRNNHGSWYWAGLACFREFCGDRSAADRIRETILPERLHLQVEPDGSQPEELGRAISQSYTAFTLCSFTNLALSLDRCGLDAWNVETADGRSLRRAIDWFLPYLDGTAPWTWRQIKPFDPASAVGPLAACAERFPDGGYRAALERLALPEDHRFRLLFDL